MNINDLKSIIVSSVGFLSVFACEEPVEPDTTPPTVLISSHSSGQTVNGIVTIEVTTDDSEGISKVEFFVNDYLVLTDMEPPYQYEWNTTNYEDGSYIIMARSYDISGNTADSDPVTLTVGNTTGFIVTFDVGAYDIGYSVQQTTDGGYIITGETAVSSPDYSYYDMLLIKADSRGNEEWQKIFGSNNDDGGFYVQQTTDGGYITTGYTYSMETDYDIWLIKADSQGNEEWNQTFGGGSEDGGSSIQLTIDGGYIITGGGEMWLIKTDSNGNEEWNQTQTFDTPIRGNSVQQTTDGGYIITGSKYSFETYSYDIWLIKTDSQGIEEWNQTFEGDNSDIGYSVQQTSDGGYVVTGRTNEDFDEGIFGDAILIKTDSQGNEEWSQTFGGSYGDCGYSVQQTSDGGYIFTGYNGMDGTECSEAWLVKADFNGNEDWNQNYGVSGCSEGRSVQLTTDGGYIITGRDGSNVWLIKTDSEGNTELFGE